MIERSGEHRAGRHRSGSTAYKPVLSEIFVTFGRMAAGAVGRAGLLSAVVAAAATSAFAADPYADSVISYVAGGGAAGPYSNSSVVLGSPERFTGEGVFPSVVTPFNPAFGVNEIINITSGGSIVVRFDEPIVDDSNNPFGIDLIVFSNTFFVDDDYPFGLVSGVFGASQSGRLDVSVNGVDWVEVNSARPDSLFPTLGYSDLSDPYALVAGAIESDFTKPVNPAFNPLGATYAQVQAAYDGSGGGTGVDLAGTGLLSISYVRVRNVGTSGALQIDAFSDVSAVPAPAAWLALAPLACATISRRRKRVKR